MSTRLARPVERVIAIGRQSVEPDVGAVAAELDLSLRRVVARLAQALQHTEHERTVTTVWCDVIHHVRRGGDAALQTKFAQRMLPQLQPAQPLPAFYRSDPTRPEHREQSP